jgi:hypothetical protein
MCVAEAVEYDSEPQINNLLKDLNDRLLQNKMCLNAKKSMVLVIDNSKGKKYSNLDVHINGEMIPKVNNGKLLGVLINIKPDWNDHVNLVYSKACKKLFILRKLKCFGFSKPRLTMLYILHIRSVLEYCSVLWSQSLTINQSKILVGVEKRALSIITGTYVSNKTYLSMCTSLNLSCLTERWTQLLVSFGEQTLVNDRYKHWLEKYKIVRKSGYSSRYNNNVHNFRAVPTRFERYRRSTIPTLIRLLRENPQLYP